MATDKIKELEEQLRLLRTKSGTCTADRKKVDLLNDLAFELVNSEPQKTEAYARQALVLAGKLDYKKGLAWSHRMLGFSYYVRCDYDKAIKYHLKALKISEAMSDKSGIAASYNSIGMTYIRQGSFAQALTSLFKALKNKEEIGDKKAVDQKAIAMIYNNIALVHTKQDNYEQALEYHIKALKIFEEIHDEEDIAMAYNNIGIVHDKLSDYEEALKHYFKALKILKVTANKRGIAYCCNNIGLIYGIQGACDSALDYHLKALKIRNEIGDKEGIAASHSNVGLIYEGRGTYELALECHLKALKIQQEIGDKLGIAHCCIRLGRVHTKLKNYDSALSYLKKGLQTSQNIREREGEIECYKSLYELYEAQNDYRKAFTYYRKCAVLKEEIFNEERSKHITDLRMRYETEKKEKEVEIYRLKNVELRREVRQRRKAEKALKEHRDQLEGTVAKRTAKLRATNVELKKEIAERKRAEKELLSYQKQLRSLAHELSLVEEQQRRRIATNLHDNISQSLMIMNSELEALVSTISSKRVRKKLAEVQLHVRQMIQRTRSMTFEISPPVLYELGLEPAMEWLVERFQERHGISCEFHDDGKPKPISEDWRSILFQSTRELLANVRKHARANKVLVSMFKDGKHVRITVEDDGTGFNPEILGRKIAKNEGFGLFNLRQRLTHLRGKVVIDSERGQGTTVTILAPLKRSRRITKRMQA